MAQRGYSEEVKAQVMAALLDGQSIRKVADQYGVPKSTVAAWGQETGKVVQSVPDAKRERIGDLLVTLLEEKIVSQIAMTKHAGDKAWLREQDASAFAMLYGVSDDKLMRLLEKFEGVGSESDASQN
jgi:transposase-like protein